MKSVAGAQLDEAVARGLANALREAARYPHGKSDPGASLEELVETTGMGRSWLSIRLTKLVAQGKVCVGYRVGEDVLGRIRRTPVYRLRDGAKDR
jgi:hypothetical protein